MGVVVVVTGFVILFPVLVASVMVVSVAVVGATVIVVAMAVVVAIGRDVVVVTAVCAFGSRFQLPLLPQLLLALPLPLLPLLRLPVEHSSTP
jgi:hypothetical protein